MTTVLYYAALFWSDFYVGEETESNKPSRATTKLGCLGLSKLRTARLLGQSWFLSSMAQKAQTRQVSRSCICIMRVMPRTNGPLRT